jgi:hypothetical protein
LEILFQFNSSNQVSVEANVPPIRAGMRLYNTAYNSKP